MKGTRPLRRLIPVAVIVPIALAARGCGSDEENLKPDEGVSPFYTGKSQTPDGAQAVRPVTRPGDPLGGAQKAPPALASKSPADAGTFSFEELDKLNGLGMKLGENKEYAEAAKAFDQVLGAEPRNRLALIGRASVGTEMLSQLSEQDRISEIGRDADLMRTLKKLYKPLQAREAAVLGVILFNEASALGSQGQADKCLDVLREAVDGGFVRWQMMETSPGLKDARKDPRYAELLARSKATALKRAREGMAPKRIDRDVDFPFEFSLKTPDGKPVSSSDLKGKVVLVDFWGTWCQPCLATIPRLIEMHQKYAGEGLAIVGISCEKDPPDRARVGVGQFLEQSKIPYACVIGDEELAHQKVPGFAGFPTSIILDETGKVRFRSMGAEPGESDALEDAVILILEETKSRKAGAKKS